MSNSEQRHTTNRQPIASATQMPRYVFLTDAPPRSEGHGCEVLAYRFLEFFPASMRLTITRRLHRSVSAAAIRGGVGVPTLVYPGLLASVPAWAEIIKSLLNLLLLSVWLPVRLPKKRLSGCNRLFVFFGGNGWFLFHAALVRKYVGLPMDVYLVDDLEESSRLAGRNFAARVFRWAEPRLLKKADRVFAISPGYCTHLMRKYGVSAEWLPIAVQAGPLLYASYSPAEPDVRSITFLGGVNELYLGALRDLLTIIREWNASPSSAFRLRLLLLSYSSPRHLGRDLGDSPDVRLERTLSAAARRERLRGSWAVFIPYSFEPKVRLMVSTSFPSKLAEAFSGGRPLLVHGPAEASLPRYFSAHNLPLCTSTLGELKTAVRDIELHDRPDLIGSYDRLAREVHGPAALEKRLKAACGEDSQSDQDEAGEATAGNARRKLRGSDVSAL